MQGIRMYMPNGELLISQIGCWEWTECVKNVFILFILFIFFDFCAFATTFHSLSVWLVHLPFAIDASDEHHIAQLLAVHIQLHALQYTVRVIATAKELVLAASRIEANQAVVSRQ